MEKLVTVATFDHRAEADLCKIAMENEGIRAFVADDGLVGTNWFLANAVGGIKIQVQESDAGVATKIVDRLRIEHESVRVQDKPPWKCFLWGRGRLAFRGLLELPGEPRLINVRFSDSERTMISELSVPKAFVRVQGKTRGKRRLLAWLFIIVRRCGYPHQLA